MTQGVSDRPWQAEARTAETRQFIRVYVVSESGTKWAFEVTDTLEATALPSGGPIIVPSYL